MSCCMPGSTIVASFGDGGDVVVAGARSERRAARSAFADARMRWLGAALVCVLICVAFGGKSVPDSVALLIEI